MEISSPAGSNMLTFAIITYAAAMTLANLSVAAFGPAVTPVNAFFLIGLDLTLRNWLALKLTSIQMLILIAASAGLSYLLNPASGQIAMASFVAFGVSALADWMTFATIPGRWLRKCLGGVAVGAAIDSIIFPTLAFGALMPVVILAQFAAKTSGGYLWALMMSRRIEIIKQ
jgi:queuosine precursor transporter